MIRVLYARSVAIDEIINGIRSLCKEDYSPEDDEYLREQLNNQPNHVLERRLVEWADLDIGSFNCIAVIDDPKEEVPKERKKWIPKIRQGSPLT